LFDISLRVIIMGVIGRPGELIRPQVVDNVCEGFLIWVSRNPALALEVKAGFLFEWNGTTECGLAGRIHAIEQMPDPSGTRLKHNYLRFRKAIKEAVLKEREECLLWPLSTKNINPPLSPF